MSGTPNDYRNTYLRFDLGGKPPVATSAILWVYWVPVTGASPIALNWFTVNAPWNELIMPNQKFTWNNQPLTLGMYWTNPPSTPTTAQWYGVDVTTQYNNWRSGNPVTVNEGIALTPHVTGGTYYDAFIGSANTSYPTYRPALVINYNAQSNDNVPKLKWPLGTNNPSHIASGYVFGSNDTDLTCSDKYPKQHDGIDYSASYGQPVYATEDGRVKFYFDASRSGGWGSAVVVEHTNPNGGKYTTTYWQPGVP